MRMTGDRAAHAAKTALSVFSICLGAAAFAAVVAIAPADAKKSPKNAEIEDVGLEAEANQPMTLVVSLNQQSVDVYRGMTLITSARVSSGKRGYATKAGVFSILEKRRHHYSNLYSGAPMPWMQRLTWSGTALHAGVVPGYPASHGCVRLPYSFAPKLFKITGVGEHVVVSHDRVAPRLVEHVALFQPLPAPAPPVLAKDHEQHLQRRSSIESVPASGTGLPVVFAKVETSAVIGGATLGPATGAPGAAAESRNHAATPDPAQVPVSTAMLEDTRVHAIDPNAAPFGGSAHAVAAKPAEKSREAQASVAAPEGFIKHQDRLAPQAALQDAENDVAFGAAALSQPTAPSAADAHVAMKVPGPQDGLKPQAGSILSVSAAALPQPVIEPASGFIAMMGPGDYPPVPLAKPSVIDAKFIAGAAAAAIEAAEPLSTEPLRILVTRRTQRDRMIDVQYILASMGYLEEQGFDGTFGSLTARAIKAFQKDNDLPETGAFDDEVVAKIYQVAGKQEPPEGHLFVRQKFASVFDTPVDLRNPDEPLGTQVFTVLHFAQGDTKAQWMAINLKGDADPTAVLDRIEIPDDVRQNISERLTPGSSLIVADTAINSATLPKGADFLVWDTSKPASVQKASVQPKPRKKRRATTQRRRPSPSYARNPAWPFF